MRPLFQYIGPFTGAARWAGRMLSSAWRRTLPFFRVPPALPPERSFSISRDLFLRGLGLVLFAAFVSVALQVEGLIGSRGILPLDASLKDVAASYGPRRFFLLPTLFWLNAGDAALQGACWAGAACSLLLALGIAPLPCLFAAWALYLSVATGGAEFFNYQWDSLLLETSFAALFLAPLRRLSPSRAEGPPSALRLLLLWILFRVVFFSGIVKLLSHDPSWGTLQALRFFFQCQPLPTPLAWWAQQAPEGVLTAACFALLALELGVPVLMGTTRKLRLACFAILVLYQVLLMGVANTNFFNLLVILLALFLVDDAAWRARARNTFLVRWFPPPPARRDPPAPGRVRWALIPFFLFILAVSAVQTAADLGYSGKWPEPFVSCFRLNYPLRFTSHYGYTVTSTDYRPQVVLEGTLDGKEWKEYRFRWAPGDLKRLTGFATMHAPRLDGQMWLLPYARCEDAPWFQQFLGRVAVASPPVLDLMASDPFDGKPPLQVRSKAFLYRFTSIPERRRTGEWWARVEKGEFCPPVSKPK